MGYPIGYIVGVDIGQSRDHTAIAVLEPVPHLNPTELHCRHIERLPLGTPDADILGRIAEMVYTVLQYYQEERIRPECTRRLKLRCDSLVVLDATGVGRPVLELARREWHWWPYQPIGVTITGGARETIDGIDWHVPKTDLITLLQLSLQSGEMKIAAKLPGVETLVEELMNYRVELRGMTETFGPWREGQHDDLVLALAIANYAAHKARI